MPRFVRLATLEELPEGMSKEVEFEGRVYALFHVEGQVWAIDGVCPHQGGPLADGDCEGTVVTCPWHGWSFDLRDGKSNVNAKTRQPVFPVKVDGQDVLVEVP